MTTAVCGPFTFSSEFDSGNFLKVEYVQSSPTPSTSQYSQPAYRNHDYEVNIWTKPDCHGTKFENGNRTWFYFSIRGGKSQETVKLNVLNLNKQVKLFAQGMQPVYRVLPEKPKWERVQDKLLINETGEHVCSISFKQRLPDNPLASTLYVAFTYPFSYKELCELLNRFDKQFFPSQVGHRLNPMSDLPLTASSTESDIYYHRECVCLSYEGRRVELITVTSMNGVSNAREERLTNLFPITSEPRPFKFPGKKVVFMSARVHPGETPSSFVLNGFLEFLLKPNHPQAILLRRLFVFKFIPILNPDGVVRGHYRTDPRGVNLNRVYLNPSPVLHPPIYAARKLLLYYHNGVDWPDDYEYPVDAESTDMNDVSMEEMKCSENVDCCSSASLGGESSMSSFPDHADLSATPTAAILQDNIEEGAGDCTKKEMKKPYTFVLSKANSLCAGCGPFIDPNAEDAVMSAEDLQPSTSSCSLNDSGQSHHQCAFEACDEDSVFYENLSLKNSSSSLAATSKESLPETPKRSSSRSSSGRRRRKGSVRERKKKVTKSASKAKTSKNNKKSDEAETTPYLQMLLPSKPIEATTRYKDKLRSKANISATLANPVNYKISSPISGPDSGLFLYLDMHGHTTKRGIFMYGNHFPDATKQAECMLLPRLMAINSPHFDFSACNFTERLMCMKDRRDGASREGSGRVACLKLTGLIRSYTLECNYNTGRIVNPMVTRTPAHGFLDSSTSTVPPKFTIEIFEGIGVALGESLLDLAGHPQSNLGKTEFRTLEGLRRSIVKRLKLSPEYKSPSSELTLKKSSSSTPGFETNALFSPPKVIRKPKTKVLVQPTLGGPLGPKRENQNLPADAKASGSQYKKLPLSPSVDCPTPGCSTAKEEAATTPPKMSLKKVMKKKSLTKVPTKGKGKKLKSKKKAEKSLEKLAAKKYSFGMRNGLIDYRRWRKVIIKTCRASAPTNLKWISTQLLLGLQLKVSAMSAEVQEQVSEPEAASITPPNPPKATAEESLTKLEGHRCAICQNILINACRIDCGHTFCRHCLNVDKDDRLGGEKPTCFICDAAITEIRNTTDRDKEIDKLYTVLSTDERLSRERDKSERKELETNFVKRPKQEKSVDSDRNSNGSSGSGDATYTTMPDNLDRACWRDYGHDDNDEENLSENDDTPMYFCGSYTVWSDEHGSEECHHVHGGEDYDEGEESGSEEAVEASGYANSPFPQPIVIHHTVQHIYHTVDAGERTGSESSGESGRHREVNPEWRGARPCLSTEI
ncbi:Cytosolic carboxypeptidase-like protein 5 [Orchesella cincta]|uniref:Cytosolic carboxypeptidase-like protein 5 n=1 Tax=Orchesella cincta TaxID=48709 RepID=A0A1D2NME3_ORCCI|nr:Cytosolic carboxypeptidase-like protein 5 [Orchesella cincta]